MTDGLNATTLTDKPRLRLRPSLCQKLVQTDLLIQENLSALTFIRVKTRLSDIDFLAVEKFEMNDQELVYTGIEIVLLTEFPELTDRMKNTFGSYYDLTSEMPEAYPVFEDVFQEFLMEKLLQHDSDKTLDRIFLFCERMARSEDAEVVNLLWISIFEPLVYNADQIKRAWSYMGHTTRSVARDVAEQNDWQNNLPIS